MLDATRFGADGFDVDVVPQDELARVAFTLEKPDGSILQRTERSAPYVLFGHQGRDYNGMAALPGNYTLVINPFVISGSDTPIPAPTLTLNFSVTGQSSLSAYPNVFTNELTVQTSQPAADVAVRLQSVTGGQVYRIEESEISQGSDGLRIDTQSLPPGHYILQVTDPLQTRTSHVIKK